ncbi:MAG: hypothetical protein VW262_08475 [Flavobacteriaceae bacterium]
MKKYNISINVIRSIHSIGIDTINYLENNFQSKTFKKGDIIINEGEITDKLYLIRKGLIRGIRNFNEIPITYWISVDFEFFTSSSYFFNTPSDEIIESIEDSVLDYLTFDQVRYAINHFDDFKEFYIKNLEIYYKYSQIRSILARIPLSKNRISYFLNNYNPLIIKRTPDKIISSFLNVKPETYSRVKNQLISG